MTKREKVIIESIRETGARFGGNLKMAFETLADIIEEKLMEMPE